MDILRTSLAVGVTALALAGCDRNGEEGQTPAAAGPAAEAPAPIDAPKRAPGLWEQRVSMEGVDFVQTSRVCLDEAIDTKLSWWGNQGVRSSCEKNLVSRQADGTWRFSSVCDMGSGGVTTTSGVASGDFASKYVVRAQSSTTGAAAPQMNGQRTVDIEAQWQGACPADMEPGDMELPGGVRMNVLEMQAPGGG